MTESKQRRAHPRIKCMIPIVISKEKPRMLSSALALNYSEGGLYFEISAPVETGDHIIVKTNEASLPDPLGFDNWNHRRAEVRWCIKIEEDESIRYGCGIQYIRWS